MTPPRGQEMVIRRDDLLAFLHALTDPRSRDLAALVPDRVPSRLPLEDWC